MTLVLHLARSLSLLGLVLTLAACQTATTPSVATPAPPPATAVAASINPAGGNPQPQTGPARLVEPTITPTIAPRPTATATVPPSPTPSPRPSPTATPTPPIRQLTEGGCCVGPSWSADGTKVIFLDRPAPDDPTGYYAVDITQPGAKPELFQRRIESWTGDFKYIITRGDGFATIERVEDGQKFRINTGRCSVSQPTGCNVSLSPDRALVSWSVTAEATGPFEQRRTRLWVANLDGSNARIVADVFSTRAGSGWFPDNRRLLLTGRANLNSQDIFISVLDLATGKQTELVRGERINRGALSPDSQWLMYSIQFHQKEDLNGLWLIKTDGSEQRKLPFFGPLAWRKPGKIVYVPLAEAADVHQFWEYDVATNTSRPLTDPQTAPLKIAFGDWALSPDGNRVVYVDARDRNLWL
ncbi:MAG: hypothetical protein KIT87_29540, partial [Anaerolineae bacterium]|nr:hypothetical protein [Anaerolineae bacterium]